MTEGQLKKSQKNRIAPSKKSQPYCKVRSRATAGNTRPMGRRHRRPRHESDGSIIGGALALRIATPFWRNCNCCGGRPLARDVDVGSYWFFRRVGRDEVVAGNSR